MPDLRHYQISCLCGKSRRIVSSTSQSLRTPLSLCHCRGCRHSSGILCTSYFPITEPPFLDSQGLVAHKSQCLGRICTRWFCAQCGCHVYRSWDQGAIGEWTGRGAEKGGRRTGLVWEVATGVVWGERTNDGEKLESEAEKNPVRLGNHLGVEETRDGGLASSLGRIGGRGMEVIQREPKDVTPPQVDEASREEGKLEGSCACGAIQLRITRPDESSHLPRSTFPDLMIPYHSSDPILKNPKDEKWWLRPGGRYLAGTCACRSCRLISGFEIQVWTFIPRSNIFVVAGEDIRSLDFENLPEQVKPHFGTYESSEGVQRNFCNKCGATFFWHDKWRPDVIDVSVGLLDAKEGSRAETWLDWWRDRVSFTEHTEYDRWGVMAKMATSLIHGLETGLKEKVDKTK